MSTLTVQTRIAVEEHYLRARSTAWRAKSDPAYTGPSWVVYDEIEAVARQSRGSNLAQDYLARATYWDHQATLWKDPKDRALIQAIADECRTAAALYAGERPVPTPEA